MNAIISPVVYLVTLVDADTEYSLQMYPGTQHFSFQARQDAAVKFAFVEGHINGGVYATLKAGQAFSSPEKLSLKQGREFIYFSSPTAGTIVEMVAWIAVPIG